jgi:hypothetical protein
MAHRASQAAYEEAGSGPESVQAVELHDCFTPNEVISFGPLLARDLAPVLKSPSVPLLKKGDEVTS